MGDSGQVHVGGSNQDAPLSAGVADINPQAPETAPAVTTTNTEQNQTPGSPTPEILTEPEPVSVDSVPVETVQTQPVIPVINTEPEKQVISDPLVPSDAELANDNPLMPVDAQAPLETRIEGSDAEIRELIDPICFSTYFVHAGEVVSVKTMSCKIEIILSQIKFFIFSR